jgi:hypothetical protein
VCQCPFNDPCGRSRPREKDKLIERCYRSRSRHRRVSGAVSNAWLSKASSSRALSPFPFQRCAAVTGKRQPPGGCKPDSSAWPLAAKQEASSAAGHHPHPTKRRDPSPPSSGQELPDAGPPSRWVLCRIVGLSLSMKMVGLCRKVRCGVCRTSFKSFNNESFEPLPCFDVSGSQSPGKSRGDLSF